MVSFSASTQDFPLPTLKADLVPLEGLLEVVPDEWRQDFFARLHPIHRHPFGRAHQGLQISRGNAPQAAQDIVAINTRGQRNRSKVLVDEPQIPLVVGNTN